MLGFSFGVAQTVATVTAMTSNFFMNNQFTYRDQHCAACVSFAACQAFI